MEVSSENSLEHCSFQKKREISKDIGSSMGKNQSKDVMENASYVPYRDLISSSASSDHIQENIFDRKTDMILLEQEPAKDHYETANRQVIELSDSDSKMILRRQFGETAERGNSSSQSDATYYENMEILRKLPPDTVVIRQKARSSKEDSDYRELMETNSSGSSSTSGCTATKPKRFTRAIRNKTRETVEVRRNPMRVSKKNIDKDFPRSKQRLLVNSRREICTSYESSKRIKSVTMPYMKTRSVTRKMYTVGATYQAPTKKDETEWKEWPVHGMHERPVYHPQAGLAVEYLGRYFTSLDGLSYYEIIDEPEIEVVAVDPHRDRRAPSVEKKSKGKTKGKSRCSSNTKATCNTYFSAEDKSFETCMHGSLHCVLGYCSQVMTPAYKQVVEEKMKLTVPASKTCSSETSANVRNIATSSSENVAKFAEKAKLIEAIAIAQNVQKKNIMSNTNGRRIAATYSSSSASTYIPETQRSIVESDGSKIIPQSGEMVKMNLKRILRDASNNSLILLRSSAAKTSGEDCTAVAKDVFNLAKLKDVSSMDDKAPTDMSSIYKKLVFASEPASGREESPVKNKLYTLKRYSTRENAAKKTFLENQLENEKIVHATKEKNRNADKMTINRESNDEMLMMSSSKNSTQCASETSEIARILSEYNNSTLRKSAMHNRIYDSKSMKANVTSTSVKTLPKDFWQKNITAEENQNFIIPNINADLDLFQEKWKRYNLTLEEKIKDNEIVNSTHNARNSCSISLENNQVPLIDRQTNLNTLKHVRERSTKSYKEREIVMTEAKSQEGKSEHSKDEIKVSTTEPLQELLENTAILYCAASGVHQDDLSNYIDTLDSKQSIQWLENWNNSVM